MTPTREPEPPHAARSPSSSTPGRRLEHGWRFKQVAPDSHSSPDTVDTDPAPWRSATVPCTVASALREAGEIDALQGGDLDESDHWFQIEFEHAGAADESASIRFGGLATLAEVWLNGVFLGRSENMFLPMTCDVSGPIAERNILSICFRAMRPALAKKRPRARWRTRLVADRNLRFFRATLFGRMPSWCPPIAAIGPWRAVELLDRRPRISSVPMTPAIDADAGRLDVSIELEGLRGAFESMSAELTVGDQRAPLRCESLPDGRLRLAGRVRIPNVQLWWPHTHGEPHRYPVTLEVQSPEDALRVELDSVAFRRTEVHGPPGPDFRIEVNGERVFCRGTCWTPIDALALSASEPDTRAALELARDAGMNMLRVPGTTLYESDAFYDLCDELGILVWQDFMFATLDYPAEDAGFVESVRLEARHFLETTRHRACLTVLCGNSEGQQQPALLGLDEASWQSPIFEELLPALCAEIRPDVAYRVSTPSGGAMPFHVDHGTSHYFGVGAYRRPFEDARVARPRFITECLALSNLPEPQPASSASAHPLEGPVPKDTGADWDFKDVTDHYLAELFGEAALAACERDLRLAKTLSRATSAELMQRTQTLWRDPESSCHGALVWLHRDPWECAGWGVVDARGRPKSAYYGLKRAWAPIDVHLVDDGLNGLVVLAYNERATEIEAELEIGLQRFDGTPIAADRRTIRVPPRSCIRESVDALLGGFIDSSGAYGFGPPAFDFCVARLGTRSEPGFPERETIFLSSPALENRPPEPVGLQAEWVAGDEGAARLRVSTDRFAQTVALDFPNATPSDNYFHLAPDRARTIEIRSSLPPEALAGTLTALNDEQRLDVRARIESGTKLEGRGR